MLPRLLGRGAAAEKHQPQRQTQRQPVNVKAHNNVYYTSHNDRLHVGFNTHLTHEVRALGSELIHASL